MNESAPGPGADLKAAREEMQVTIREVADALNLPARVIECLEADDYERLPPSVFTRGYLRSYARLLELPVEELLDRYPQVTEELEAVPDSPPPPRPLLTQKQLGGLVIAGAVLLLLLLIWLFGGDGADEGTRQAEPGGEPDTPAGLSAAPPDAGDAAEPERGVNAGPPAAEPEQAADSAAALNDEAPSADAGTPASEPAPDTARLPPALETGTVLPADRSIAVPPPVSGPAPPASQVTDVGTEADAVTRSRRLTEFGDDLIEFTFSEDCWVEVKNLAGEMLYSDLNRAGSRLRLTGRGPFRILLGYAPGVRVTYNGTPVDLARVSRNNVASLVLGE